MNTGIQNGMYPIGYKQAAPAREVSVENYFRLLRNATTSCTRKTSRANAIILVVAYYLRLSAFSLSVLLTLAFTGLWERSYSFKEGIGGSISAMRTLHMHSHFGNTSLNTNFWPYDWHEQLEWQVFSVRAPQRIIALNPNDPFLERWGFHFWTIDPKGFTIGAPHWFLAIMTAMFAVYFAYRLSWKVSIRSAFIVTTLVAMGLGLIIGML